MVRSHWICFSAASGAPFLHFICLVDPITGMVELFHHHESSAVWAVICGYHQGEMVKPAKKIMGSAEHNLENHISHQLSIR